jgi:NAD(P)-dependent dehydrogenase (short-subunit alcohol dehydrogenase family)
MEQKILAGKTALITGASKGLGKAMSLALGQAGAKVALVARDRAKLQGTADELEGAGIEAEIFLADVASESDVLQLERDVVSWVGKVDILINNAGVNVRKHVTDFTLDEWNSVVNTNLTGAFLLCRAFVPHMKGSAYGRILNMTSIMSHISLPGRAAYSASKAGLLGFTRALALELASEGVTVVAISPGPFATEMNAPVMDNPELNQQFISRIPVGRWGQVEDIGKLALFLCSEDARFITGTDIVIDGGWCAQ